MVRVGGGWDTLAHYLDKHDPCRCRAQHRTSLSARLARPKHDLAGATVTYERPDPGPTSLPYTKSEKNYEPMSLQYTSKLYTDDQRTNHYQPNSRLSDAPASLPYLGDLDRSHSPSRKHLAPRASSPGRKSSSPERRTKIVPSNHLVPTPLGIRNKSPRPVSPAPAAESASDNGSEVSDEGYRSLGVVAGSAQGSPSTKTTNRYSMHSQNSIEDAEYSGKLNFLLQNYLPLIFTCTSVSQKGFLRFKLCTAQTFVYINMSVCDRSACYNNGYEFTKKKYITLLLWNIVIFQNSLVWKIVPYVLITRGFFAEKLL
jgi:hypothetical protein